MDAQAFIEAGKLPRHLLPWNPRGNSLNAMIHNGDAFLFDVCIAGLHLVDDEGYGGYTVMDDSDREVSRHLNAVRHAHGKVLKTGLGFGCFVRMCLEKPEVEHVDVVEIDGQIIDHFGSEFAGNPRVKIHHFDAFKFPIKGRRWDMAWHDIYCEANDGLQVLHSKLIKRYWRHCNLQGAWGMPRWYKRCLGKLTGTII
jgi:hypothetical protein